MTCPHCGEYSPDGQRCRTCAGRTILAELHALAATVERLPAGAELEVKWLEATPDLMLLLANEDGSDVADYPVAFGQTMFEVVVKLGAVTVIAHRTVADGAAWVKTRLELVRH